tara:strand:+ start:526 stop:1320 length:795 start_codon:yes stop_codon:yes gene_type:complete
MKTLFIYVLLFFVSCGVNKKTEEVVVARVGNQTLSKKDLLYLTNAQVGSEGLFSRKINNWVKNQLLYQAALSIGLDKDIALIKESKRFYENLLISSFKKIKTKERIKTTKKEVSDYYLKNKKSFKRIDDEVVVKHFTFSTKKEAEKTKKELKRKKTGVGLEEFLNKQQVETKTVRKKEAGSNLLGFLFTGDVGDVFGPKEHNEKFHIFHVLQKHKKDSFFGLEKVYDEIYQRLYKEKERLILAAVIDSLYLNSDVFVSQEIFNQ